MTLCSATASWPPTSPSRSAAALLEWAGETTVRSTPALSPSQVHLPEKSASEHTLNQVIHYCKLHVQRVLAGL